jgi:hypothetical protein
MSCHATTAFTDGDTFSGAGAYSGKTFLVIKGSASSGLYIVETSDTWDTN